jgi:hypothetical protein
LVFSIGYWFRHLYNGLATQFLKLLVDFWILSSLRFPQGLGLLGFFGYSGEEHLVFFGFWFFRFWILHFKTDGLEINLK